MDSSSTRRRELGAVPKRRKERRASATPIMPRGGSRCASIRDPVSKRIIKMLAGVFIALALALLVNWIYQVARKPSELFFPVSRALDKTPTQTWRTYAPLFRQYSTPIISADFLAALAQSEGAGNPVARTYWRWSWGRAPFATYRPASTSVGLYQMTDGVFAEAKNLCIRDHKVGACGFGSPYFRIWPSHAIELTAAYLDRRVSSELAAHHSTASVLQASHLAAVIHLCGAGVGDSYIRRGFRLPTGTFCGDQDPQAYLNHLDALGREFALLAEESGNYGG